MASQVSGVIEYIQPGGSSGTKYAIAATAYGVCDVAASESIKNVDMTGFKLERGMTVHIKFTNANSASNPKLKFNSEADTNAKPIVQYGTTAAGTTEETNGWYAGAVLTLTYDGTSWVRDQGFNTNVNTWRGIQDKLTSDSATDSLSAKQGKVLKGLIDAMDATTPAADGNATAFIDDITQTDGKITSITKKNIPTASTSTAGIIKIGTTANDAAAGNHNHNSTYSHIHLTDYSFTATKPLSKYVTFDKSSPEGAPATAWYNGFISSHNNYLASYIINEHRTANWYVGYGQFNTSTNTAPAPTWYLLAHSGNVSTGDDNGQVKIAGQNVSVKGLKAFAYKDSLATSDIPDLSWNKITSDKPDYTTRWPKWNEISQSGAESISEGTSDVSDNTEILTSYASDNGFADTHGKGIVYRRDAIHIYNYINGKLGTMAHETASNYAKLDSPTFTGTPKSVTPSSTSDNTMIATKEYVDGIVAANDAMVYKGIKAGAATSSSNAYGALTPAANCGDTYKVSAAGFINGLRVEVGDMLICTADNTAEATSSNYTTIRNNWNIIQTSEGSVSSSSTSSLDNALAVWDSTSGRIIKNQNYVTYLNHTAANAGTAKVGYLDGLLITGNAYGEKENLISDVAGQMSYGDAGPQIRFNSGSQLGAMIFNHYDSTSGMGASFHFVSNQGNTAIKSDGLIARTRAMIGGNSVNNSYVLYSNGATYINGALTANGTITAKGSVYEDSYGGALNMNNSNIYGLNSIYTADASDRESEGIHFYRDTTHVDSLWINGGNIYFVPNRALGTSTTAANSQKVLRGPTSITTDYIFVAADTTGLTKQIQATNANTASTIVQRDASGNFSAGTITANLNGNANTADSAKWLMNRGTDVTISDGPWSHGQTGSGGTNAATVWHQKWKQSGLTFTKDGTTSNVTDSGDMVLWLAQSTTANILTVNMAIDGMIYAAGGFKGNLTGNASTATKSGTSAIWLYPENSNEINFGGSNTNTTLYIGYRTKDSRPIPTKFIFGSSTGTADLQAKTVYLGSGTSSYISSTQYTGNAATTSELKGTAEAAPALTTAPSTGNIRYSYNVNTGTTGLFSSVDNANSIITLNKHNGNYNSQLGFSSNGNIYYRNFDGDALNNTKVWEQLAFISSTVAGAKVAKHASTAHWYTQAGSPTGVLKVKIKKKQGWMLAFTIRVYQAYTYDDYVISGYNYGSNKWYSPEATILGSESTSKHTVTFGYDDDADSSGYRTLWVSIPVQQYTGIDIFNVTNGYSQIQDISNAFEITHETESTGTVQTTVDCYRPWYRNETVSNATTATNLSAKPSLAASENNITVTAGGKTSDAFTVPYATSAGSAISATTATSLTNFVVSTYTIAAGKGVRIKYPAYTPVLISCQRSNSGGRLILIGGGYGEQGTVRNDFTELVSPNESNFTWSMPEPTGYACTIEIMNHNSSGTATVWVESTAACTFTEIDALTSTKTNRNLLHSANTSAGTNNNATLAWSTTYTIAKINGTDIKFTTMAKPTYSASDVGALASTTKYAASGSVGGAATNATTTANTTDSIYPVGVKSGATTTLLHDTSITMKGNAITAVTYNSTAASLTSETSTTANTAKYATLTLGNNANVNTTTAHSEGQIVMYSAATQAHTIKGTSTTIAYTHTLPNDTGLLVSLSGGTAKGSSTKPIYIPNTGIVTECSTYAGGTKVTFNGADKGASTASFYAPTAGGTAGHVLIGAGTTTAPAWYGGTVMSGSAAASWKTAFNGTTDATASNAAAVTIAGGLGIAKSIIVGTTATITNDTRSPKFTLTVNDADKAYLQYNTTDDSIDFIFV